MVDQKFDFMVCDSRLYINGNYDVLIRIGPGNDERKDKDEVRFFLNFPLTIFLYHLGVMRPP